VGRRLEIQDWKVFGAKGMGLKMEKNWNLRADDFDCMIWILGKLSYARLLVLSG
jgi:hypothetical protein